MGMKVDVASTSEMPTPTMRGDHEIGDRQVRFSMTTVTTATTHGFLFADLRGYTHFVETHGDDAAAALLTRYRALVREVIGGFGGAEIRTEGDSFYVVFPSASSAVLGGLAILAAAQAAQGDPAQSFNVGIGVHAGETAEHGEGPIGSAVNIAARVCAQARPGELLVTDTVRSLTRTRLTVRFTPRGSPTLKGIREPILLFAVQPAAAFIGPGAGVPARRTARMSATARPRALAAGVIVLAAAVLLSLAVKAGPSPARSAGPGSEALGRSLAWRVYPDVDLTFGARQPDPHLFEKAHISGVSASGEGYIAVGTIRDNASVAVWDTSDGQSWEQDLSVEGIESGAVVTDVASAVPISGDLVLVGSTCTVSGSCQAAAWRNGAAVANARPGERWIRATFRDGDLPADTTLLGVGAGGAGYVAVGVTGTSRVTAFWTSSDGATWTRIALSGSPPGSGVRDVVGGGPGFIAVGSTGSDGTVWTSSDGASWSEAPQGGIFAAMALDSVTATSDGLLLTGHGAGGPAIWSSVDGLTWNLTEGLPHLSFVVLRGIASNAGDPIVAVGDGPTGEIVLLGH